MLPRVTPICSFGMVALNGESLGAVDRGLPGLHLGREFLVLQGDGLGDYWPVLEHPAVTLAQGLGLHQRLCGGLHELQMVIVLTL